MSNPRKIYNDYVRANLPNGITFDSNRNRYDINSHSFFSFSRANWYLKYITKFGYSSLSSYAVNNFDPDLVFDFKQNYYRTGGSDSTLSSSVTHTRASSATMTNSSGTLVTVGNNVPRVGHHIYNGSAWVNEGILHESEARTNLLTHSNDFTASSWTRNVVSIASNVSGVTAPDGSETVDKIIPNSTSSQHRVWDGVSSTAVGETYSVYAKSAGYDYVWLGYYEGSVYGYAIVNLTNGVVTASNTANYSVEALNNGFYRISVTKTASGTDPRYISISPSPTASPTLDSNNAPFYSGDGTSGIYVWGAQLEAGSTPSSYIPTSGSQVTRAAETLTVPAANLPYSSTNMSIQMDGRMTYADENLNNQVGLMNWARTTQIINCVMETDGGSGRFEFNQRDDNGVTDTVETGGSVISAGINVPFNIASRNGSTFLNGAFNGTALTANTTPTAFPSLSSTDLKLGNNFMGTISKFRMWDEDLTDAGIAEAST